MDREYGSLPESFGTQFLGARNLYDWHEYMHYLYLPVAMATDGHLPSVRLPPRLQFLDPLLDMIRKREGRRGRYDTDHYVYVTARRGYATPGNPINRPGWHTDGFGTDDVNYIWSDRWPTKFADQKFEGISDDHVLSIRQFEAQVSPEKVRIYRDRNEIRNDPSYAGGDTGPQHD